MEYRGHEIAIDKDECGEECVYVYTRDGGDPIEIIGGVKQAKAVIDQMIADLAEYERSNVETLGDRY